MRALPEDHALRALGDEGTYSTMITLCGNWQQLRRALELVDDMRSRSLDCGLQVLACHCVCARAVDDLNACLVYYQTLLPPVGASICQLRQVMMLVTLDIVTAQT